MGCKFLPISKVKHDLNDVVEDGSLVLIHVQTGTGPERQLGSNLEIAGFSLSTLCFEHSTSPRAGMTDTLRGCQAWVRRAQKHSVGVNMTGLWVARELRQVLLAVSYLTLSELPRTVQSRSESSR